MQTNRLSRTVAVENGCYYIQTGSELRVRGHGAHLVVDMSGTPTLTGMSAQCSDLILKFLAKNAKCNAIANNVIDAKVLYELGFRHSNSLLRLEAILAKVHEHGSVLLTYSSSSKIKLGYADYRHTVADLIKQSKQLGFKYIDDEKINSSLANVSKDNPMYWTEMERAAKAAFVKQCKDNNVHHLRTT